MACEFVEYSTNKLSIGTTFWIMERIITETKKKVNIEKKFCNKFIYVVKNAWKNEYFETKDKGIVTSWG